jgi:hypothetical protein
MQPLQCRGRVQLDNNIDLRLEGVGTVGRLDEQRGIGSGKLRGGRLLNARHVSSNDLRAGIKRQRLPAGIYIDTSNNC